VRVQFCFQLSHCEKALQMNNV